MALGFGVCGSSLFSLWVTVTEVQMEKSLQGMFLAREYSVRPWSLELGLGCLNDNTARQSAVE